MAKTTNKETVALYSVIAVILLSALSLGAVVAHAW
jgi:hypothetical protein